MRAFPKRVRKILPPSLGLLTGLVFAYRAPADVVVVDPDTRNGSFETGAGAPWGGCEACSGAGFAPDGAWFAQTAADVSRADIFQFLPAPSASMRTFMLSFQTRNGTPPFATVAGSLSAQHADGSYFSATVLQSSPTPLTNAAWTTQSYTFAFPEGWDESRGLRVGIFFGGGTPGAVGMLDDVRLTQISEPIRFQTVVRRDGAVTLTIRNLALPYICTMQRSTNLAANEWTTASAVFLTESEVTWFEAEDDPFPIAFYRIVQGVP